MVKICVFTGASEVDGIYKDTAINIGRLIGQRGHDLIYGGSNFGLMGIVSSNARKYRANVTEIIPTMWAKETNPNHKIILTKDFAERKNLMQELSDAFITLPGGVGSLDEFFEILVARQIRLYDKPNVILNINRFYDPILKQLGHMQDLGFLNKDFLNLESSLENLYHEVSNPQEAIEYIEKNI